MRQIEDCILCKANEYEIIHHGVRDNANIDVLRCKNCGLVRLSEFLYDAENFYRNSGMYDYENYELRKMRIETSTDSRRRFEFTRNRISNKVVCDFGCGAGGYLLEAQSVAKKVYGIEVDNLMYRSLNQEGVECFRNIDEAEKNIKGKIDVITLWHVLEHLENPIEMLQRLKGLLAPKGTIYIEVPNAEDALISLYDCKLFMDFTYWKCHLFLYTNETLKMLAYRAGLKIKFQTQIQRYPLSNHLYWLANGKPGGHVQWHMMNEELLNQEYAKMLIGIGKADTLLAEVEISG